MKQIYENIIINYLFSSILLTKKNQVNKFISNTGTADFYYIAIHEIGHMLGLLHSNVVGSIMWREWPGPGASRDLSQDDINGIRALYGPRAGK